MVVDVQRKWNEFNIFNLVTCNIYKNGCCVHLKLLTAVEYIFFWSALFNCDGFERDCSTDILKTRLLQWSKF